MARTITLAFLSTALVAGIILQSNAAFQASLQGLSIWWNIVFPGLLPYFVLFELMTAFGLTHALGALLGPAVSRLFKLPGEASAALLIGWLGGGPMGAEASAELRRQGLVTTAQGQRLLALAHMPNPIFMVIVAGSGFLHKPALGLLIAVSVWLSAIWLLFIVTLMSPDPQAPSSKPAAVSGQRTKQPSLLRLAAGAMQKAREADGRSFGKALGEAVAASVQKLMLIGGFIIFAAVAAKLTELALQPLLMNWNIPFITQAFFEAHLGAYAAAVWQPVGGSGLLNAAVIASALSWSGASGILQASHAISGTDLRLRPFIAARLLHAIFAFCFAYLLWKPLNALLPSVLPAFLTATGAANPAFAPTAFYWSSALKGSLLLAALVTLPALALHAYARKSKSS